MLPAATFLMIAVATFLMITVGEAVLPCPLFRIVERLVLGSEYKSSQNLSVFFKELSFSRHLKEFGKLVCVVLVSRKMVLS